MAAFHCERCRQYSDGPRITLNGKSLCENCAASGMTQPPDRPLYVPPQDLTKTGPLITLAIYALLAIPLTITFLIAIFLSSWVLATYGIAVLCVSTWLAMIIGLALVMAMAGK